MLVPTARSLPISSRFTQLAWNVRWLVSIIFQKDLGNLGTGTPKTRRKRRDEDDLMDLTFDTDKDAATAKSRTQLRATF